MSNINRVRSNLKLQPSTIKPEKDRDQYFPEDFIKDMDYVDGKEGDLWDNLLEIIPCIKAGTGIVTRITDTEIAISAFEAWIKDSLKITIVRSVQNDATGNFIPDISAGDGIYYVKIAYVEDDEGSTRVKVYDATSYFAFTKDGVTITIDQIEPISTEIGLGGFTVTGGVIVTEHVIARSPDAKLNHADFPFPDGSIPLEELEPSVQAQIESIIITKYRGVRTPIYQNPDSPNKQGYVFGLILVNFDEAAETDLKDINGIAQAIIVQEQRFPLSRVDQKQEDVSGSGYSVLTALNEAAANIIPFSPLAGLLFSTAHHRVGIFINSIGSGYTGLRIQLHNISNDQLGADADILIGDLTTGWNFVDLDAVLDTAQNYHYHIFVFGFTTGTTPVLGNDTGNTLIAFRELYLPTVGEYGASGQPNLLVLINEQGAIKVPVRTVNEDDITTPGTGFAGESTGTNLDFMAVDLSTKAKADAFDYQDYIGVDLATGRFVISPNSALGLNDTKGNFVKMYAEFNIKETLNDIDAKNILRHQQNRVVGPRESIEDSLDFLENAIRIRPDAILDFSSSVRAERIFNIGGSAIDTGYEAVILPETTGAGMNDPAFSIEFPARRSRARLPIKDGVAPVVDSDDIKFLLRFTMSATGAGGEIVKLNYKISLNGAEFDQATETFNPTGGTAIDWIVLSPEIPNGEWSDGDLITLRVERDLSVAGVQFPGEMQIIELGVI